MNAPFHLFSNLRFTCLTIVLPKFHKKISYPDFKEGKVVGQNLKTFS